MSANHGVLADQLQVWGFDGEFAIFSDGSLGFGLEAVPIDVTCWDTNRVNALSAACGQWLNGLPTGIDVQFVQTIERGNAGALEAHRKLGSDSKDPVALRLVQERTESLQTLDQQGNVPYHGLKVFVRRPLGRPLLQKPKLFSRPKLFEQIAERELNSETAQIKALREQLMQGLSTLGLRVEPLSADRMMDIIYRQWNPSRPIARGSTDPENVRASLLLTDALLSEKGFSLGDMHYRVVSLKILPECTFAAMANCLRELPFDSELFVSVHVPNQQKELAALQTQRRLAFAMARGKRTGVSDIESEAKFQDLETLLTEMIAQGEKVFQVSVSIVLRHQSTETLDLQVNQVLSKVRELSGAEAMVESLAAFDIFSELAIPNARARERAKRMKTSTLADFLPVYGPWRGHECPRVLLRSRSGSLIGLDPFSAKLSNYNHVVSGGSGSGKSFLTNVILLQMLKENLKIFIVDIGGSYKKICSNLGGQYIPLGESAGLSINPFDLAEGQTTPDGTKVKFLLGLIECMTKEDGDARLPRLVRAEIEEAIARVYDGTKPPSLSVLRELLLAHTNVEIRRYGRILTPWCGDTVYGRFVDRPTTIELKRSIVSFDLKGIPDADLQSICLLLITEFVWREVQKDRGVKKFLVFDECWRLLENEAGAAFIGEVYRTFRKYYASCIGISQNIDDFAKSKVAGAILSNSAIKWILMQKGADQARLKEVLQLNSREMGLVASLHQEKGYFSEAFLIAGDDRALVAVGSTPLEYWIATSDPRDLAAVDDLTAKSGPDTPILDILKNLATTYPKGMSA